MLLELIKKVCSMICDDEFTRLGLEEQLLTVMIRCHRHTLSDKKPALTRLVEINKLQQKILGA